MRAALVSAVAISLTATPARAAGPDFIDALEAGTYITGGLTLGFAGFFLGLRQFCDETNSCGDAGLPLLILGGYGSMGVGAWLGAALYEELHDYDGSAWIAMSGFLGAGALGAVWASHDEETTGSDLAVLLSLMVVGTGAGFVFGGQPRSRISVDSAMLTPMGDDGIGVGLSGRF